MIGSLLAARVFDLPSQNTDYNITADNARSYQLREVAAANARVQKAGQPSGNRVLLALGKQLFQELPQNQ
jgi:hypothetical protein